MAQEWTWSDTRGRLALWHGLGLLVGVAAAMWFGLAALESPAAAGAPAIATDLSRDLPVTAAAATNLAAFEDLDDAGVHKYDVEYLDSLGLFDGTACGLNRFCPSEPIERWVVAVWLVRALDGENPVPDGSSRYSDVDAGAWWVPYVERLADLEVTLGCAFRSYCPDGTVTRGQMASFLRRAYNLPEAGSFGFEDIDRTVHRSNIDALAAAGITIGCAPARFCPDDAVTRAEMSAFIGRALRTVGQSTASSHPDALSQGSAGAKVIAAYSSGAIDILVYYCAAEDAGYTVSGLQSEVQRANELVGQFFRTQSGGRAQINFVAGSIVSPAAIDWSTASMTGWHNNNEIGCDAAIAETVDGDSDPRIVILADVPFGSGVVGYAWYGGTAILPTLLRWNNDSLRWADTFAHEIGHSVLELGHTFEDSRFAEDPCSLMSYCGPPDISRMFMADLYCEDLGWADPPGSGCPTQTQVPSAPPGAASVSVSVSGSAVSAFWSADDNGSAIIEWDVAASGPFWSSSVGFDSVTTSYTWGGLSPGGYSVVVRARNAAGWGPWGTSNTVTVAATPSVTVQRGDPGPRTAPRPGDIPCAASSSDCRWLRITMQNFPAGRYRVYCAHDGFNNGQFRAGFWEDFEVTVGNDGSRAITRSCYINIARVDGQGVRILVGEATQPRGQYRWSSAWLR